MPITYEDWPETASPKVPKNVVEATLVACFSEPNSIVQVKTYKTMDAAKTGATLLDKALAATPERFPGTWRWMPAMLDEPVQVNSDTHVAEIRARYVPEEVTT
jgi:hypothetical protein